jgi:signal peptidase II
MKPNTLIIPLTVSLIIAFIDQLTKFFFTNKHFTLIPKVLDINFTTNTGAAFGILKNLNPILIIVSIIVILLCFKWIYNKSFDYLPLSFIIGGAIGNLTDRFYFGFVRDFIDFKVWPVFNLADTFITIAILIILYMEIKK